MTANDLLYLPQNAFQVSIQCVNVFYTVEKDL